MVFQTNIPSKGTMISAVAGSGKTSLLVEHYCKLVEKNISPSSILTMTFTNKAAEQLKRRILKKLSSNSKIKSEIEESRFIGTIHSFCYYIIEKYGSTIGLPPIKEIVSVFEWSTIFSQAFKRWLEKSGELLKYYRSDEIKKLAQEYMNKYELIELWRSTSSIEHEEFFKLLEESFRPFIEDIRKTCLINGKFTFNWLEYYTNKILSEKKDIIEKLDSQINYILIDEFQDTSELQWNIIKKLINNKWEKFFAVGDPFQSIYGFRNADVRIFFEAKNLLKKTGGELINLKQNYRTLPALLKKINELGKSIFKDSEFLFTNMESKLEAKDDDSFFEILYYDATDPQFEITTITRKVKFMLKKGVEPSSIALLFRVSDRISKFYDHFYSEKIPVNCIKTGKFQENYNVVDIINFLKFIENPLSNFYLVSFLRSSFMKIEIEDIRNLMESDKPLFYTLLHSSDPRFSWLVNLIKSGTYNVRDCLKELFLNTNGVSLQSQDAVYEFLAQIIHLNCDVSEAVSLINEWMKDDLSFGIEVSTSPNSVSLQTVHAAKGLEFDHVFLVDNMRQTSKYSPFIRVNKNGIGFKYRTSGIMEKSKNYEELEEIERINQEAESKRILYVALTRCRKSLTISLPQGPKITPNTWASLLCAIRDSNPGPAD